MDNKNTFLLLDLNGRIKIRFNTYQDLLEYVDTNLIRFFQFKFLFALDENTGKKDIVNIGGLIFNKCQEILKKEINLGCAKYKHLDV